MSVTVSAPSKTSRQTQGGQRGLLRRFGQDVYPHFDHFRQFKSDPVERALCALRRRAQHPQAKARIAADRPHPFWSGRKGAGANMPRLASRSRRMTRAAVHAGGLTGARPAVRHFRNVTRRRRRLLEAVDRSEDGGDTRRLKELKLLEHE